VTLRNTKFVMFGSTTHKAVWAAFLAVALSTLAVSAKAGDLVTNGGFESNGGNGQLGFNTSVADWSIPAPSGNYAFIFAPGTADTTGANGEYGNVSLWGPGNGVANGLPATSPNGGYFLGMDSAFQVGALSQTIGGLTPGDSYTVGFWWAAGQQSGFSGASSTQWQVSLGSQTQNTAFANIPSQGFSGWMYQTFNFTATNSSEVLSFLANGSPQVPPFALLDGVSLTPTVPEPGSFTLMLTAVGVLGVVGVLQSKNWFRG